MNTNLVHKLTVFLSLILVILLTIVRSSPMPDTALEQTTITTTVSTASSSTTSKKMVISTVNDTTMAKSAIENKNADKEEKVKSSIGHDSFDYDNSDGSDHTAQTIFGIQEQTTSNTTTNIASSSTTSKQITNSTVNDTTTPESSTGTDKDEEEESSIGHDSFDYGNSDGNDHTAGLAAAECTKELDEDEVCCDGYLSIGTLDFNFEASSYYETNWPSQFFAQVIDNKNRGRTCCFKLSSADESNVIEVIPDLEMYEFEEEKPVHNVVRCMCGNCTQ